MFARTLRDQLIGNSIWVKNHVGSCVEANISSEEFSSTLLPLIEDAANQGQSQKIFEGNVAHFAQDRLRVQNCISKAIDCINGKVIHEAKSRGMSTLESLYLPLSCALFSRYLYNTSKEIGYTS